MKYQVQRRKTGRFYFGAFGDDGKALYWKVRIKYPTKAVDIDGSLLDAMLGTPGATIGCHLSNCAKRNADKFPHDCLMAAFTKSTCLILSNVRGGQGTEAYKYAHSYGRLVDMNDRDVTKQFIRDHPELVEQTFRLRPPRMTRPFDREHFETGLSNQKKRHVVPRGALRRAVEAGLVSRGLLSMGVE